MIPTGKSKEPLKKIYKINPPEGKELKKNLCQRGISRRRLLKGTIAGICLSAFYPFHRFEEVAANPVNPVFWVKDIPSQPFYGGVDSNHHRGIDNLLQLMGDHGLKFYRSSQETTLSGPSGMIEPNDIVLIKVNAQWKYRGCTNSDLIRGLIHRILDHPDGFDGEVVIFENGQGRGSLNCDTTGGNYPDTSVHANANDKSHSFLYLVNTIFNDPRVSSYLLDPVKNKFIGLHDHVTDGYRKYENVSYPCFTTAGGHRIELREGVWQGNGYSQNLKLINVPVLKHHDTGGSEITASLKHLYGVVSMSDGQSGFRHYSGLGETCGKMVVSVRTPVLNIIDAIWVSHSSLKGYPASTTFRANQILCSQDPVALDYCAVAYIMYPISKNPRHLPTFQGIDKWLTGARDVINSRGGLYNPDSGILIDMVTKNEEEMLVYSRSVVVNLLTPNGGEVIPSGSFFTIQWRASSRASRFRLMYSLDNGLSWTLIPGADDITGNSYDWKALKPWGNKKTCLVNITGYNDSYVKVGDDNSDSPFTIQVVRVDSPKNGDILVSGKTCPIVWTSNATRNPVTKVNLYYTKDGETTWVLIISLTDSVYLTAGSHSFNWKPKVAQEKTSCKVKVELKDASGNTLAEDTSNGYFTIRPAG